MFWYDKTHAPVGWYWEFPIHERLNCDDKSIFTDGRINLNGDILYLEHWPDNEKPRSDTYKNLLLMRANEYPNDIYGLYYLARQYEHDGDIEHSFE